MMNRDKQIEEMNEAVLAKYSNTLFLDIKDAYGALVDAGYRKASDVALEVIRKVEQIVEVKIIGIEEDFFHNTALYGDARKKDAFEEILVELAELKKKYTESENDNDSL